MKKDTSSPQTKSTYCMPFIQNSRECKLNYTDSQSVVVWRYRIKVRFYTWRQEKAPVCLHLAHKHVFMNVHGGVCVSRRQCVQTGLCVYQCAYEWVQTTHRGSSLCVSSPSAAPASLLPQIFCLSCLEISFFFSPSFYRSTVMRDQPFLYGSASS